MNKKDIVAELARRLDLSQPKATQAIDALLAIITEHLSQAPDARIALPPFGIFRSVSRPARQGKDPRTGTPLNIAATVAARFQPSVALKAALNPTPAPKAAPPTTKKAAAKRPAPRASVANATASMR